MSTKKRMNKKFELTKETNKVGGVTLFRIRALVDLKFCKKGELGGWIESEKNLSVSGNAWVSGDARVFGNACVYGNARVYGNAWVYGYARVYGYAWVYDNAWVCGDARVCGNARVSDNAWVCGDARVYGNACVYGDARVFGKIKLKTYLCSRFSFEYKWQLDLWFKKEAEFLAEVEKRKKAKK